MKFLKIKNISLIFVLVVGCKFSVSAFAQSCSGGTTTVASNITSSQYISDANSCYTITPSGSLTDIPLLIVGDSYAPPTGMLIQNNGSITWNYTGNYSGIYSIAADDVSSFSLVNNGSIATTINGTNSVARSIEILSEVTIPSLTNAGSITASAVGTGTQAFGIYIGNRDVNIINLTNTGSITSSAASSFGIYNIGTINTLTNSGAITSGAGFGILNDAFGTINTLTNSGTITVDGYGIYNAVSGTINTLANSGTITSNQGIVNYGHIDALNNSAGAIIDANPYASGIYNATTGAINILNNSGSIMAGYDGYGVRNFGTINTLINSGSISAGVDGKGIYNQGLINTLTNTGSITGDIFVNCAAGALDCDAVSKGSGRINTLNNSGTISGDIFLGMDAPTPGALPSIGTLNNSGSINSIYLQYLVGQGVAIETVNNTGQINNGIQIIGVMSDSSAGIGTLRNSGSINGGVQIGSVGVTGSRSGTGIQSFINTGTVTGGIDISGILYIGAPQSGIELLTNTGSIGGGIAVSSVSSGSTGIITLNNLQGGTSSPALTYSGLLPTNYNIIINSPGHYGQLDVISPSGAITNFGIYGTPLLTSRTYSSVLTNNVTVTNLQNTYDNMSLSLVANGGYWDLTFTGASLMGTQQSLVNTANALAPIFTLQNSVLANSFSYDCNVFGANDVCVSAGGRNTAVSATNGLNNTSALLIAAYRPHPNYRIGAYADQNLSVNNAGSTVNLGNSTPLIGLFGAWNERLDGTGTEVKVSAAYGQKNTTVTRQVVGLSEAGSGSSQLNSQGAQILGKYGFAVADNVIVSPYLGMRYTQNNMGGYTEASSSDVTAPLTYSALNTNATTALAGVGVNYKVIPQAMLFASAGVESDMNTSNGTYSATGITGLTPINFNPNPVKTRATATLGAYYDIEKNHRVGITGIYRQEPFSSVSTTSVLATYTVGL